MNWDEMSDFEINCRVVDVLGILNDVYIGRDQITRHCIDGSVLHQPQVLDYCNNPSDAWPVIVANKIGGHYGRSAPNFYFAVSRNEEVVHADKNPLRTAMIVFLKMEDDKS